MSVSKYRYSKSCDGQPCPGDCDLCGKEETQSNDSNTLPNVSNTLDALDLISRRAAITAVTAGSLGTAMIYGRTDEGMTAAKEIIRAIKGLPSAQPDLSGYSDRLWKAAYERGKVEGRADIVCCKDCKQYDSHGHRCKHWNHGVSPTDWCSYAERRTDA